MERLFPFFPERRRVEPALLAAGLCPPLPVLGGRLVWGSLALEAAVGLPAPPLREMPPGTGLLEALRICLLLEDRREGYSFEELRAIRRGLLAMGMEGGRLAASTAAGLLGPGGRLQQLERWESLGPVLRALVDQGRLELKAAESVSRLPEPALSILAQAARELSFSERRRFFLTAWEVARRDGLEAGRLESFCRGLLEHPRPLSRLEAERFPERSALEAAFDAFRDEVLRGSGVALSAPPDFEGDRYKVEFKFAGADQLKRRIKALQKLQERAGELDGFL